MFRLDLSPTFRAAVRWEMQDATGNRMVQEFTGEFRRYTVDDRKALIERATAEQWDERRTAAEVLVGWGADVTDKAGNALPFTPDNLAAVLNVEGTAEAVLLAFRAAAPSAARKN